MDALLARITLRLGRKIAQQEVLDLCIELGEEHFEDLLNRLNPRPVLDDAKIARIISMSKDLADVPWEPITKEECSSDEDFEIFTH